MPDRHAIRRIDTKVIVNEFANHELNIKESDNHHLSDSLERIPSKKARMRAKSIMLFMLNP
jgi:hypothetical protein